MFPINLLYCTERVIQGMCEDAVDSVEALISPTVAVSVERSGRRVTYRRFATLLAFRVRPLEFCAKCKSTFVSVANSSFLPRVRFCTPSAELWCILMAGFHPAGLWLRPETPRHDSKDMLQARKDMPPSYEASFL